MFAFGQSSGRAKKLADICFKLNVEDSHTVNYALKKLVKYGLVQSEKQGKEVFYGTTHQGQALCMAYRDVRESCLVDEYAAFEGGSGKPNAASLNEVARQLRLLSGLYDKAAQRHQFLSTMIWIIFAAGLAETLPEKDQIVTS